MYYLILLTNKKEFITTDKKNANNNNNNNINNNINNNNQLKENKTITEMNLTNYSSIIEWNEKMKIFFSDLLQEIIDISHFQLIENHFSFFLSKLPSLFENKSYSGILLFYILYYCYYYYFYYYLLLFFIIVLIQIIIKINLAYKIIILNK